MALARHPDGAIVAVMALQNPPSSNASGVRTMALLFASFALPASMLGVIWPEVQIRFNKSLGTLGFVGFVYGLSRLLTSISGRTLIRRVGMGRALVGGIFAFVLAATSLAVASSWPLFLCAVSAVGLVSGVIDSVGAGFITRIGDVRAGLIHGCYGVGATIGPLVVALSGNWRIAVGLVAAWGIVVAISTLRTGDVWPIPETPSHQVTERPRLVPRWVAMTLALYAAFVGLEVTLGTWANTYLVDHRNLSTRAAALGVSAFWGGLTIGRLLLSRPAISERTKRIGLLSFSATGFALVGVLPFLPAVMAAAALLLVGVALAPIIPSLLANTAQLHGSSNASRLAGYQLVAANVGAISAPTFTGKLVDRLGPGVIIAVTLTLAAFGTLLLAMAPTSNESSQ